MASEEIINRAKERSYSLGLPILGLLAFLSLFSIATYIAAKNYKSPCANSITCIKDLSGRFEEVRDGTFMGRKVEAPLHARKESTPVILGAKNVENKRIYIDLSTQKLRAFEGNTLMYEFPVSTGKWNHTPKGDFRIWIKLRYTRMSGGSQVHGTYYNLPNVPYTMYFYNKEHPKNDGYGIHGAYWHNNFGQPMSHGCVNMREEDVAKIYAWAHPQSRSNVTYADNSNPGTPITIYGQTPPQKL